MKALGRMQQPVTGDELAVQLSDSVPLIWDVPKSTTPAASRRGPTRVLGPSAPATGAGASPREV